MPNEKIAKLYKREWLNTGEGGAYIIVDADVRRSYYSDKSMVMDAQVTIADCTRRVELDFDVYEIDEKGKKLFKERINKLDLLINHLQELKDFMIKHEEEIGKGTPKSKKK